MTLCSSYSNEIAATYSKVGLNSNNPIDVIHVTDIITFLRTRFDFHFDTTSRWGDNESVGYMFCVH